MTNEDIVRRQERLQDDLDSRTEYRFPAARIAGEQVLVLYDIALSLKVLADLFRAKNFAP